MSILQKLKDAQLVARKSKRKFEKDTLTTILGDLETHAKDGIEITDNYVVDYITKAAKTAKSNFELSKNEDYLIEASIYSEFLPDEMTLVGITRELNAIASDEGFSSMKDMRALIDKFKEEFTYRFTFDTKVVSKLAKSILENKNKV